MSNTVTPRSPDAAVLGPEALRSDAAFRDPWYYSIEMLPGVFTKGLEFESIRLTRALLARCGVEGRDCLDIGPMDGLVTTLLCRRGAGRVVACDRAAFPERIALLKRMLGVQFDYVSGVRLDEMRRVTTALGVFPMDVVVFSGVLYHVFDPLGALARVRGMVRTGGIVIVETAAVLDDVAAMYFNERGKFYPSANYWKVSAACLDYLLRMMRLEPIDAVYHRQYMDKKDGTLDLGRLAVACRAVDSAVAAPDDEWLAGTNGGEHAYDFREHLDWDALDRTGRSDVAYDASGVELPRHADTGSVDLARVVRETAETRVTDRRAQVALALDALV